MATKQFMQVKQEIERQMIELRKRLDVESQQYQSTLLQAQVNIVSSYRSIMHDGFSLVKQHNFLKHLQAYYARYMYLKSTGQEWKEVRVLHDVWFK